MQLPKNLPKKLNICGSIYKIVYTNDMSEVDIMGREMLWGQIDFQTNTIRIFVGDRPIEAVWKTLLHEIMHGILIEYNVQGMMGIHSIDQLEMVNDTLSSGLFDTLERNKLFTL